MITLLLWPFWSPTDLPTMSFQPPLLPLKALWKLNWFLQDFGYDTEPLGRDEVGESQLVGLSGVVKISHIVLTGTSPAPIRRLCARQPL